MATSVQTAPTRRSAVWLAVIVASAAAGYWWFEPSQARGWLFCPFHRLTGLYCPGCGSTRAIHLLLHGQVLAALRHNVLVFPALAYLGWAFVVYQRQVWFDGPPRPPHPVWVYRILVVGLVGFWVLRNIPIWPLTLLAPP